MNRDRIIQKIHDDKIIAISRGLSIDKVYNTVQALVKGGITLLEFTFEHEKENYIDEALEKIRIARHNFSQDIIIGAGTVLTVEEVERAVESGAKFIVSPNIDEEVIKRTLELGAVSIPGALTPTEAVQGYKYGGDFIKLFPAAQLGSGYIKGILAPLKHIPFLAVGGVNADNVKSIMELGVCGIGVGSQLFDKDAISNDHYDILINCAIGFRKAME